MATAIELALMGAPGAIDLIQSKALQGDPNSRALLNAAGGTAGLAAGMMMGGRLGGKNYGTLGAALGSVAGYLGGGYASDRAMDALASRQPESESPQAAHETQRPQFDQETILKAQLTQLNQQKRQREQQALQMLNMHLGQGQGVASGM